MFFVLYLVVYVFGKLPVVERIGEPDKESSEKSGQNHQKAALPSELDRNPADTESDDSIDDAADAHVEQKFQRKRQLVVAVDFGRCGKGDSDQERSNGLF